jgi:hypothetical protein
MTGAISKLKPLMPWLTPLLFGICIGLTPSVSLAHKPSDSYLEINVGNAVEVRWDIALRDLEMLVGLDSNFDGQITWGEVKQKQQDIIDVAIPRLAISIDDVDVPLRAVGLEITDRSDGAYAVLKLRSDANRRFTLMKINYDFFFDVDLTHRGLIDYHGHYGAGSYVASATDRTLNVPAGGTHWFFLTLTYVSVGAWHTWMNYDYLLFLIALVLPSVWQFKEERLNYIPAEAFAPAIQNCFWIATSIVIAQGITLWLAVYGTVDLPSQWGRTMLAVVIVLSAMHNMYPVLRYWAFISAIAFGLAIGFIFGDYLIDLGLPSSMVPVSLLGFSIGVEVGQLAILAVLFPIAYLVRRTKAYDQYAFHGGSTIIVILGGIRVIERLSGRSILGF